MHNTYSMQSKYAVKKLFKKNAFVNLTDFAKGVFPPNINIKLPTWKWMDKYYHPKMKRGFWTSSEINLFVQH